MWCAPHVLNGCMHKMLLQVIDIVSHLGVGVDKIGWGKLTSRPGDGCSTSSPLISSPLAAVPPRDK